MSITNSRCFFVSFHADQLDTTRQHYSPVAGSLAWYNLPEPQVVLGDVYLVVPQTVLMQPLDRLLYCEIGPREEH